MARERFALTDPRDLLLANVAIRIQLSPTNHKLAVSRLETLATWLDREASPLAGKVTLVYAQGSMSINATIASALRYDEFDIDAIVQMVVAPRTSAQQALDLLFEAVRGERGSRYYNVTTRNTRCVTVEYRDMHVDLTPAELIPGREPRVSYIFHHRPEEPRTVGKRIVANPFGFADWFNQVTPRFHDFEKFFESESRAMDVLVSRAAQTEEVPEPIPTYLKSPVVIAHQLVKRFRNVQYDKREGRQPPSVLLAFLMSGFAGTSGRPFVELLHQARSLRAYFEGHQNRGVLIHVTNPRCLEDVFSDRWPATLDEQGLFLKDLRYFVHQLERIEKDAPLDVIADVFARLFGEEVSKSVIREFADTTGRKIDDGALIIEHGSGRIDLGRSGIARAAAVAAPATVTGTPRHTFYGPDDE
jgi:hypothetical protein